jgi:hypothetical protein
MWTGRIFGINRMGLRVETLKGIMVKDAPQIHKKDENVMQINARCLKIEHLEAYEGNRCNIRRLTRLDSLCCGGCVTFPGHKSTNQLINPLEKKAARVLHLRTNVGLLQNDICILPSADAISLALACTFPSHHWPNPKESPVAVLYFAPTSTQLEPVQAANPLHIPLSEPPRAFLASAVRPIQREVA